MKNQTLLWFILILLNQELYSQETKPASLLTKVTPHLHSKISKDTNVIYCSTFQIAWNEFKNESKGDILLNEQMELVKYLNLSENTKESLTEKDYFVASGVVTEALVKYINSELKSKFNGVFSPINDNPNLNNYVFYSFLYKNLKFKEEFEKIKSNLNFEQSNTKTTVQAFGINKFDEKKSKHKKLRDQLDIYYKSKSEFVVKLKSKHKNEEIILAMIEPSDNMLETINKVEGCLQTFELKNKYKSLMLSIPNLYFDINHSYNELIGKEILNERFKGYSITEAIQDIFFQLDETGAIVKSKATMKNARGIGYEAIDLIIKFNKPFLVILKEKDKKMPYLVVWVANSSIMKIAK